MHAVDIMVGVPILWSVVGSKFNKNISTHLMSERFEVSFFGEPRERHFFASSRKELGFNYHSFLKIFIMY